LLGVIVVSKISFGTIPGENGAPGPCEIHLT